MEQRVSRSELRSPESTPPPSPSKEALEKLKALGSFDYIYIPENKGIADISDVDNNLEDGDEEIAFQLFAPTNPSGNDESAAASVQKIRLKSPSPDTSNAGFVIPARATDYYVIPAASGRNKENFTFAAVSGEDVLQRSHSSWPGSTYPWKVTNLPASSVSKFIKADISLDDLRPPGCDGTSKHKRPGKKARIKTRQNLTAMREKEEKSRFEEEQREIAEREKKTRRNREKQAKKRAREKAKKAADVEGGDATGITGNTEVDDD